MEREKRKKMTPEENAGGEVRETKKNKKTRKDERETAEVEVEEPSTEEVEEFYAILRRMDVALRYLKGAEKRLSERRMTAETVEEKTAAVRIGEVGESNKELNLNEMPADSTN